MKILVAGAGGMVGRAVAGDCAAQGDTVVPCDHNTLDITDPTNVLKTLEKESPDAVINCAAWTDVDGCELDRTRAQAVNSLGPRNLATACRRVNALLITISTDYVFDGEKEGFYTQRDQPLPTSVYGKAKLEGERNAQTAWARTIIVRSGWIFGEGGRNFLSRILELGRKGERLHAIADSYGTPTYAKHLARRLRELADLDLPGIYHVVNSGDGASFGEFTREALRAGGCDDAEVIEVAMDSLKRPAPRPRNSRLQCILSPAVGLSPLPDWRLALREFASGQPS